MRRARQTCSVAAALVLAGLAVGLAAGAAAAGAATAHRSGAAARPGASSSCTAVRRFTFSPHVVQAGGTADLEVTLHNCTDAVERVTATEYGHEHGCAVIDPIARHYTLAAKATRHAPPAGYLGLCVGVESITGSFTSSSGAALGSATARFRVRAGSSARPARS